MYGDSGSVGRSCTWVHSQRPSRHLCTHRPFSSHTHTNPCSQRQFPTPTGHPLSSSFCPSRAAHIPGPFASCLGESGQPSAVLIPPQTKAAPDSNPQNKHKRSTHPTAILPFPRLPVPIICRSARAWPSVCHTTSKQCLVVI